MTSPLHFLILTLFLFSTTIYFPLQAASRGIPDLKTEPEQQPLQDTSTKLDEQMLLVAPLAGNKPMPAESLLPSFPTFLRPILFPSPFGRFRPVFPFRTIPRLPPTHDDTNLPSKPSVPSSDHRPRPSAAFLGSPPVMELP
ncbi:hypothetical protein DCAR_0100779 [Daucus carota subsp. sativus]|uniref:Uncharacterized protein n=1 Tax=Daucus carota subsp. sativus TaxID=79200 RepID=A0A166FWU2_DAUCS|nr:hypothetical protein DCAR_0100779 [Daucus carota subsp. sativus]